MLNEFRQKNVASKKLKTHSKCISLKHQLEIIPGNGKST